MVERSFLDGRVTMHAGDCLEVMAEMGENSVDACVCDPPYHLASIVKRFGGDTATPAKDRDGLFQRASRGFMNQKWDGGEIAFRPETWAAVLRVLKPGGHVVAFGAPKMVHWMAVAIEMAGFEVRDRFIELVAADAAVVRFMASLNEAQIDAFLRCIDDSGLAAEMQWIFGVGFPKSHNQDGEWHGWGTAAKPAYEPIVLARKPLIGTVAANLAEHGTGALNIDGCRVETGDDLNGGTYTGELRDPGPQRCLENRNRKRGIGEFRQPPGRWPANVIHDGSDEVVAAFPDAAAGKSGGVSTKALGRMNDDAWRAQSMARTGHSDDAGSAARFFYSAKADANDRIASKHPTVKPVDLMQWLVRLVTPKGGLVLDPFAGTGTTGEAAWREGMRAVLIERESEYQADIARRMALAAEGPDGRRRGIAKAKGASGEPMPLFGGDAA